MEGGPKSLPIILAMTPELVDPGYGGSGGV